jgi:copper oxidase (laccase) domain-containing protein
LEKVPLGEPGVTAWFRFTDRSDGDLALASAGVERRRRQLLGLPWTWLRQAHGAEVVVVRRPGAGAGCAGDAAVTIVPNAALSVQVADCAPLVLIGETGGGDAGDGGAVGAAAIGVVHAGWRGLIAGVVPAAVGAMRRLGAGPIRAVIGPCIHTECYEFGAGDLDAAAMALGESVRGRTAGGRPALDLVAGARASLRAAGIDACDDIDICTGCSPRHWSHRAAGERERQAVVACLRGAS